MSRTIYRLLWIPSALAIAGMTVAFATQPMALPVLQPLKPYTTSDRSLRLLRPGNWKAHERSSHGVATVVEFDPIRNARMVVTMDLQGSLAADIMKATDSQTAQLAGMIPGGAALLADRKSPLERLHAAQGALMKRDKLSYPSFEDGATVKAEIAGKEALVTTCSWNAPGLFGSRPVVGRRATLLSGDHQVSVVYSCLKEMEPVVLPIFKQMMRSMEIDAQGGGQ